MDGAEAQGQYSVRSIDGFSRRLRSKAESAFLEMARLRDQNVRSLGVLPGSLPRFVNQSGADVVNLHWLGGSCMAGWQVGMVRKPVVWRLPDLWPISGALHYPIDFEDLLDAPAKKALASQWTRRSRLLESLLAKIRRAGLDKPRFVATSNWMRMQMEARAGIASGRISDIPNALPTEIFGCRSKEDARADIGLEIGRPTIGFLSANNAQSVIKGSHWLSTIIQKVRSQIPDAVLVTLDNRPSTTRVLASHRTADSLVSLPFTESEHELAKYYAAFDVVIVPSVIDAFNQVTAEALACGTPVVAFNNSGPASLILHEQTGLTVNAFDLDAFAESTSWLLNNEAARSEMGAQARQYALEKWSYQKVADSYARLYRSIYM